MACCSNSWNARVVDLKTVSDEEARVDPDRNPYHVTTENVDSFKWTPGVEFYL